MLAIWHGRNELVWNQRGIEVPDIVESAKVVLNYSFDHHLGLTNLSDRDEHWVLPSGNKIKVNSDAALFESSNCFSYAFVVRDSARELIEARLK